MEKLLFLGMGGFIGTICRYLISAAFQNYTQTFFYAATLAVNLAGSLFIGFLSALFLRESFLHPGFRLFFITGMLGGFTTFSSFSMETLKLIQQQRFMEAAAYVFLSISGGLLFAALGWYLSIFITD
ncbi:MAG: fluoride efflux transporter CrcB [Spirochaetia bacterium]|nr:fluoride efflux transporter CrcB [Spirochaetia bacterium]